MEGEERRTEVVGEGTRFYSAWHLNLKYSSVEKRDRPEIIERCYWPILKLAESTGCPQGIEISGASLRMVQELNPGWIEKLIELESTGLVEVIASGYEQIVGPLAPAEINRANISHGLKVIYDVLGVSPSVYFVNEQCASTGVLSLAEDSGFQGAIMEWENAWISNQNWPREVGLTPQRFRSSEGLGIIWNHSRLFQGLQRFVHKELALDSLLGMYKGVQGVKNAALCFYGGDAETFDFRAGRFSTEAKQIEGEWNTIEDLVRASMRSGATWIRPSDLLTGSLGQGINPFNFESPILTKKQPKYNVVRWAVSGRNNYALNNLSYSLTEELGSQLQDTSDARARDVLELWSSDLRTHITDLKWSELLAKHPHVTQPMLKLKNPAHLEVTRVTVPLRSEIKLENKNLRLSVDPMKGMTISGASCRCQPGVRLIGRLPYGAIQGPLHSPDWYSGNFVQTPPGQPQDSDISFLPESAELSDDRLSVESQFSTTNFKLRKTTTLDPEHAAFKTSFEFEWKCEPVGSLRAGFMTLIPDSWDWASTRFGSHDGGTDETIWRVSDTSFDMGAPVSPFVSANNLAPISEGTFWVGDSRHRINIALSKSTRGAGLMLAVDSGNAKLFRSFFTLQEFDDTFRSGRGKSMVLSYITRLTCSS